MIGCVLLALVVVFGVIYAVLITRKKKTNDEVLPSITLAPTTVRESLGIGDQIGELLGNHTMLNNNDIHQLALDWIINKDPLQLGPMDANLLQRYILVFFYFHTSRQGPWAICNPPQGNQAEMCRYRYFSYPPTALTTRDEFPDAETITNRWLIESHECDWAGIDCNSNDKVTRIALGKSFGV